MTDTPGDMAAKLEARADGLEATIPMLRAMDAANKATRAASDAALDRAAASMLRECAEREKALREALQGVLSDDDASTSLADQRARWPERMAALKRAMGE